MNYTFLQHKQMKCHLEMALQHQEEEEGQLNNADNLLQLAKIVVA